tara:strand:+ start:130 stop:444 length:315 start_codon:yes stop_codon:yes gene_type:complete
MVVVKNKKNNFKKKDIVKRIFKNIGISSLYSTIIINDLISILITNLILKKKIKIKNFGTFTLHTKNERTGRNPKSKVTYTITKRIIASFNSSNYLKFKINNVKE